MDGSDVRIGIIRTRWNDEHVSNLVKGCRAALKDCNVKEENIFETSVPGAYELPLAARFLALSGTVDAIVTAGVLIKGDVRTVISCLWTGGISLRVPMKVLWRQDTNIFPVLLKRFALDPSL